MRDFFFYQQEELEELRNRPSEYSELQLPLYPLKEYEPMEKKEEKAESIIKIDYYGD